MAWCPSPARPEGRTSRAASRRREARTIIRCRAPTATQQKALTTGDTGFTGDVCDSRVPLCPLCPLWLSFSITGKRSLTGYVAPTAPVPVPVPCTSSSSPTISRRASAGSTTTSTRSCVGSRRERVTIFSSRYAGWEAFDREYPHEVIRLDTEMMLPTPAVRRRLHDELRSRKPDVVAFGATWPLGHMGPAIRRKLGIPYIGFTHGLELTGTLVPGLLAPHRPRRRDAHGRVGVGAQGAGASRSAGKAGWSCCRPGIDTDDFRPDVSDAIVRERHALGSAPGRLLRLAARGAQGTGPADPRAAGRRARRARREAADRGERAVRRRP